MTEQQRLHEERNTDTPWKKWGPYVSERQWGTVREDYSADGDAWAYTPHDAARSKAWRWGEEGIAGICDDEQLLCLGLALWNKKDPIIKERYFGLSNEEGNHGEDVKELYYYLDSTPTHSYMKMLYKYPQQEYPYTWLVDENKRRSKREPEFELMDTGIFNDNRYFDVFVEYAKADAEDMLIKITVYNRGPEDASLHVMPTIWFRNTWAWGYDGYKPHMTSSNDGGILIDHRKLGIYKLHLENQPQLMFCENETNIQRLYNAPNTTAFCKDGINDYLVHGNQQAINSVSFGTKAAVNYDLTIKSGQSATIRLRLEANGKAEGFETFDDVFNQRIAEADAFYAELQKEITVEDEKLVQRQAFAGMLWSKQRYYYNVDKWLKGDPAQPPPPPERKTGRNHAWAHFNGADIISMP
ncbi:MAG TPA: glucosidase, partial [Chitinophagaceae bacterium]